MGYSEHKNNNQANVYTFMHELGHTLGIGHNDQVNPTPSGDIYFMYDYTIGSTFDAENFLLLPGEITTIENVYDNKPCPKKCELDLSCKRCNFDFAGMVGEERGKFLRQNLLTDCEGNIEDELEFSIDALNSCFPLEDIELEITIEKTQAEFLEFPQGFNLSGTPTQWILKKTMDIAADEYFNYDFKVKFLNFNTGNIEVRYDFKNLNDATLDDWGNINIYPPVIIKANTYVNAQSSGIVMSDGDKTRLQSKDYKTVILEGPFFVNGDGSPPFIIKNADILVTNKNAEIIFSNNTTTFKTFLGLENVNIMPCGDFMWKGLKLYNGSKDAELTISNCTINDALYGLRVEEYTSKPKSPKLTISNTKFINNYIGMDIIPIPNSTLEIAPLINVDFINDRDLYTYPTVSSSLIKTKRTFYGIRAYNTSLLHLGFSDDAFEYTDRVNSFTGLKNGIYLENSNLISTGAEFYDMGYGELVPGVGVPPYGYGIYTSPSNISGSITLDGDNANVFSDLKYGILANNCSTNIMKANFKDPNNYAIRVENVDNKPINIGLNTITLKQQQSSGIQLFNNNTTNKVSLRSNVITLNRAGTRGIVVSELLPLTNYEITQCNITTNDKACRGIHLIAGGNNVLSENTLINNKDLSNYGYSSGIRDEGSIANIYKCNVFNGWVAPESRRTMGLSLRNCAETDVLCNTFNGNTYGLEFWGMGIDSDIKGNQFVSNRTGLYYGLYPSQGDAFSGEQQHYGNTWFNGTFLDEGAEHLSSNPDIVAQSAYLVDPGINPLFTTQETAITDWIQPNPSNGA
jgi:hypothetical protein